MFPDHSIYQLFGAPLADKYDVAAFLLVVSGTIAALKLLMPTIQHEEVSELVRVTRKFVKTDYVAENIHPGGITRQMVKVPVYGFFVSLADGRNVEVSKKQYGQLVKEQNYRFNMAENADFRWQLNSFNRVTMVENVATRPVAEPAWRG